MSEPRGYAKVHAPIPPFAITSVAGRVGAIVLTQADVSGTRPLNMGGTGQTTAMNAGVALFHTYNAVTPDLIYGRGSGTNTQIGYTALAALKTAVGAYCKYCSYCNYCYHGG